MVRMTVKLIMSECFPEKEGVWGDEDFTKVENLQLVNKNIKEIDNLDLFDNIAHIDLSHNSIERVENLGHLMKLHTLDLRNNMVDEEGLFAEGLPSSLRTIFLGGNPCACSSTLNELKIRYPDLVVFDSVVQESTHVANNENDTPNPASSVTLLAEHDILDSEAVLREVVDRKCRLQALVNINMEATIQELEKEYDDVTMASRNRKNTQYVEVCEELVDLTCEHVPLYQVRLGELKASSASHSDSSPGCEFFQKLRAKSLKKYEEKIREIKSNERDGNNES